MDSRTHCQSLSLSLFPSLSLPLSISSPQPTLSVPLRPRPPTGSEEEAQSISGALTMLRELLSSVDQQVLELERTQRLQEVRARLDPRAQAEVRGGGVFRGGELLRRRLLHEGTLLWKTQGSRLKGVCVYDAWDCAYLNKAFKVCVCVFDDLLTDLFWK